LEPEEVDKILQQTYFANQGKSSQGQKRRPAAENGSKTNEIMRAEKADKAEYLLVDGYNIIFAWDELRELAADNLDAARAKLLDYLSKYQNVRKNIILVVFDAYRVPRQTEEIIDHDELRVIFTRENQTADQYIEKFARENQEKYEITVATSDSLEQMIIRGDGCTVISAAELKEEIDSTNVRVMQVYREKQVSKPNRLKDVLSETSQQQMAEFIGDQGEAEE
jgi:predicted RNA-binding protein with PIN domain